MPVKIPLDKIFKNENILTDNVIIVKERTNAKNTAIILNISDSFLYDFNIRLSFKKA